MKRRDIVHDLARVFGLDDSRVDGGLRRELFRGLFRRLLPWRDKVGVGNKDPLNNPGKYFSALGNEANLKGRECGWLVFGVRDNPREIVGSNYRPALDRLK